MSTNDGSAFNAQARIALLQDAANHLGNLFIILKLAKIGDTSPTQAGIRIKQPLQERLLGCRSMSIAERTG